MNLILGIIALAVVGYYGRKAIERPSGLKLEPGEAKIGEMYGRTRDISLPGFIVSGSAKEGKLILTNRRLLYGRFDEKRIALSLEPREVTSVSVESARNIKFLQLKAPVLVAMYLDKKKNRQKTVTWTVPAFASVSGLMGSTKYPNPHTAESFLALLNNWKR